MRKSLAAIGAALAATAAITLSACSSSGSPATSSSSAEAHNSADVAFATDMIPHHAQALTMSTMALTKATDPKVIALAKTIRSEQSPEITRMSAWLKSWNESAPATSTGGMHMSGMHMPGMMTEAEMTSLDNATGIAFDKLFLAQMITHHAGALTMAKTELGEGRNNAAKKLASSITKGQSAQISQMKALLPTVD